MRTNVETARVSLTAEVEVPAGVTEELLTKQIVEAFEMLGITVEWDA